MFCSLFKYIIYFWNNILIKYLALHFICFFHHQLILGECPRKFENVDPKNLWAENEQIINKEGQPPGIRPAQQFIQTTFAYRDLEALDRDFSQTVKLKLSELRPRLRREAFLILDNENLDCGDDRISSNINRCNDYPLNKAFHYLIVEDSRNGAAVYSLSRERNWESVKRNRVEAEGRLEMALLDALSRHSTHSLLEFGIDNNALPGFIREIGISEMEQQIRENNEENKNKKERQSQIQLRSPFELKMLNLKILAERQPLFEEIAQNLAFQGSSLLKNFHGSELVEEIESQTEVKNSPAIFVLFWGKEGTLGIHALHLWERLAYKWENQKENMKTMRELIFGVVKCDGEEGIELCRAFGVLPIQRPQFLAFMDGQRVGQQMGLGDEKFFINWIRLILLGSLIYIKSNAELIKIQKELIEFGPYTLGIFRDEQQTEFKNYRRVAVLLAGRYQLAYKFDKSLDVPRLSTFRISFLDGNSEEMTHIGAFNTKALLKHITRESMPIIMNISYGFTTDLAIRPEPTFLLIYDSTQKMSQELRILFSMLPNKLGDKLKYIIKLIELDKAHSLPLEDFLNEISLRNMKEFNEAVFCVITNSVINCVQVPNLKWFENEFTNNFIELFSHEFFKSSSTDNSWQRFFSHKISIDVENKPHPLMQLQLEQINSIFGRQKIKMKPETSDENLIKNSFKHYHNSHNFDDVDTEKAAISGCPMMAHLHNLRDEL